MRINWKSPLAKAFLMMLCLGCFIVAWPIAFNVLFNSIPGGRPTDDDTAGYSTTFAVFFVGIFMGIHGALMINEHRLWLQSKGKRILFLIVSGILAAGITREISTGGAPDQKGPAVYMLLYFLLVQSPPLLWFLYNLHGESWLAVFARQRNRRAQ